MSNVIKEQLEQLNTLGNALKMMAVREVLPLCIHYRKQHTAPLYGPRIAVNFQDFKQLAGGNTVIRTKQTQSTTYEMIWLDVGIECVVFNIDPDTISKREEIVLGPNDG